MLFDFGRNLAMMLAVLVVMGISVIIWPIEDDPGRILSRAGARLAYANDETLLIGATLEGPQYGDEQVALIAKVPSMRRVSLRETRVTRVGVRSLRQLSKLDALDLGRTRWSADCINELAALTTIKELHLDECEWLRDEHLISLASLPHLEILSLTKTNISRTGIEHLTRFGSLRYLVLVQCPQIGDSMLDSIVQLGQQRNMTFNISGTDVTRDGLMQLRSDLPGCVIHLRPETMVGLREIGERGQFLLDPASEIVGFRRVLNIDGLTLSLQPGDLGIVSRLSKLLRINLEQSNVDDAMLMELADMPQLLQLRLSGTRVMDDGLKVLERLPGLRTLSLIDTEIEGPGLQQLRHVPLLESLSVQSRQGDEILPSIASLKQLQVLVIHAPITDSGVEQLAKLDNLQSLTLIESNIRSDGIGHLSQLTGLKELELQGGLICDSDIDVLMHFQSLRRVVLDRTQTTRRRKKS